MVVELSHTAPNGAIPLGRLVDPPAVHRRQAIWDGPVPRPPGAGPADPAIWLVGLHGGAGVSTLVAALPSLGDARRRVPCRADGQSPYVAAVCRATMFGLARAQDFARQHAAGLLPSGISVVGLVCVADAPGRLPTEVRRYRQLVAGGYSACWELPWLEAWRNAIPAGPLPRPVKTLGRDLARAAHTDPHRLQEAIS
jgi:hypothetical protein